MPCLSVQRNAEYESLAYWDSRYSAAPAESTYEWCMSYSQLKPAFAEFVLPVVGKGARSLVLGCGNSGQETKLGSITPYQTDNTMHNSQHSVRTWTWIPIESRAWTSRVC